ncbi:hypothetical protein QVD17_19164 [Tagetes erecta]|uniref:Uncharacterized protein n=1 Tax=Tagetes erecta TaxID=13708 RepID=A0AAD8NPQ5_TARER|nr:hypothetical protein QVD17_19164 [Tagetes erecta]
MNAFIQRRFCEGFLHPGLSCNLKVIRVCDTVILCCMLLPIVGYAVAVVVTMVTIGLNPLFSPIVFAVSGVSDVGRALDMCGIHLLPFFAEWFSGYILLL